MKRIAIAVAALALAGFAPAHGQETCVVCKAPEATYRCTVEKAEKLERLGRGVERAVHVACAKELARQGGHASCSVRREAQGSVCVGDLRNLSVASLVEALSAPGPVAPVVPVQPPVPAAEVKAVDPKGAPPKVGPPRTVQELAERTSETSKQQLKDASDSVGGAMQKTWACLSSLFKRC